MKILPAVYCALFLASCAAPPDTSHTVCPPPPEPQCMPGVSHARGIDTANIQPGYFKYHIDLLPSPINSNNNENAIAFYGTVALLSAENTHSGQGIYASEMLPELTFRDRSELISVNNFQIAGTASYSTAEGMLYFAAKANNDDPNDYDLYTATLSGSGSAIKAEHFKLLEALNKKNNFDAQPAISKDGLMIVFVSDRAGGHGGTDLWYSTRPSINSGWSEPNVLPAEINTPCDELSPSFSADGKTLFFSSDGHETIGGYDIFRSEYSNGAWTPAENIGFPINTKFDEIFPYQLSDSQFFYTSDQPTGFKERNIFVLRRTFIPPKNYTVKIPEKKIPEKKIPEMNAPENRIPDTVQITGKVELPATHDSLPNVFVRDVQRNKEIARKHTDSAGGYSFRVEKGREYDVGSDLKDKFYDIHRIDLRHPADSIVTVPTLVIPDTLVLRINFPFDDATHPYDFIIGENGEKTDTKWQTSIDLLAKSIKNSSLSLQSVILYGHTDSLGTDAYNFDLAKRRAEFVSQQLVARGIPQRLLVIFSKGKTMPVRRSPGESDETFSLRCRRVEFVKFFSKEKQR